MATWPSSSTTIMAVSWSSTVDGDHLAQLHQVLDDFRGLDGHLVRRSATLMVSGTWTSRAMNSCGAGSLRRSFCWLRPPRPPDLPPPAAGAPAVAAGGLSAGFLREASSDQVEETSAVLMVFFEPGAPGLASFLAAPARSCRPAAACPTEARQAFPARERAAPARTVQHLAQRGFGLGGGASSRRRWTPPAAWRRVSADGGAAAGSAFAGALAGSDLAAGCWACGAAACEEEDSDLVANNGFRLGFFSLGLGGFSLDFGLGLLGHGLGRSGCRRRFGLGLRLDFRGLFLDGAGASAATDSTGAAACAGSDASTTTGLASGAGSAGACACTGAASQIGSWGAAGAAVAGTLASSAAAAAASSSARTAACSAPVRTDRA